MRNRIPSCSNSALIRNYLFILICRFILFFQVSEVQREFQECSHNISTKLYEDIQKLEEGRFSRDTNDLAEELIREDTEVDSLDPLKV